MIACLRLGDTGAGYTVSPTRMRAKMTEAAKVVKASRLSAEAHKALLNHYRRSVDPEVRLRAHILLLLDAGHPWATIGAVLFCSASTISRWKPRYEREGVDTVLGRPGAGDGAGFTSGRPWWSAGC